MSSDSPNVCGIVGMFKSRGVETVGFGFLILGNAYAQVSAILSLATNVIATFLMACKAWLVLAVLHDHLNLIIAFARKGSTGS